MSLFSVLRVLHPSRMLTLMPPAAARPKLMSSSPLSCSLSWPLSCVSYTVFTQQTENKHTKQFCCLWRCLNIYSGAEHPKRTRFKNKKSQKIHKKSTLFFYLFLFKQNNRILTVGKDIKDHPVQPWTQHHPVYHQTRHPSATSTCLLSTSRDGDVTTSLGSLF